MAIGELGPVLDSLSWPETSGGSEGPVTQHKKVRCYSENVKLGDDRNYEIEKIRKDEDTIESVERSGRSADCVVETAVTKGNQDLIKTHDLSIKPPNIQPNDFSGGHNFPNIPSDFTRLDNSKSTEGFDNPNIPIYEYGKKTGGEYEIPKNNPPNLLNDYAGIEKQEHGLESEKSYGSSTSMRRQESYDHQEYSNEKTRTLPGWRPGWGGGEAADDPRWRINYETSANDINEVNRGGHFTGNLLIVFLLEMFLVYALH